MFEALTGRVIGGMAGLISSYLEKKQIIANANLRNSAEVRSLEAEYHRMLLAGGEDEYEYSSSASQHSSSVSSSEQEEEEVTAKIGINKLGTPYFASLEKRVKGNEFFSKEEFDV